MYFHEMKKLILINLFLKRIINVAINQRLTSIFNQNFL